MSLPVALFAIRIASAVLLLGLLGLMGWLIYREMRTAVGLSAADAATDAGSQARLTVLADSGEPPLTGTVFPLVAVTTFGRSSQNTIVLNDSYASSRHARISRRGRQWWLEDLQSRNGTLLNDLPLKDTAVLAAGDVISIGKVQFQFLP
jgi:pSer/pThr/pTyr-binding forkhead associated (FHA) protein